MKISFYGMRRSGNHAILEWLCHSISGGEKRTTLDNRIIKYGEDTCYLNEVNTMMRKFDLKFNSVKNYKNIILTYEDQPTVFKHELDKSSIDLVVVRDLPNLMASRIKRGTYDMKIDDNFFKTWLQHTNQPFEKIIQYEKWLVDKNYRDEVLKRLNFINLDNTQTIGEFGNGSSFIGKKIDSVENLFSRWKQVEIPEKYWKQLDNDDIINARKKLNYI